MDLVETLLTVDFIAVNKFELTAFENMLCDTEPSKVSPYHASDQQSDGLILQSAVLT